MNANFWMKHFTLECKHRSRKLKPASKTGCKRQAPQGILDAIYQKWPKKFSAPPRVWDPIFEAPPPLWKPDWRLYSRPGVKNCPPRVGSDYHILSRLEARRSNIPLHGIWCNGWYQTHWSPAPEAICVGRSRHDTQI